MKKSIIITLLAAMPFVAGAETGDNDTIVIKHPKKVTIIAGDSIQKIIVKGKEDNDLYEYQNTILLVDSNYVSSTEINKETWSLRNVIPSVSVSKSCDSKSELLLGGPLLLGFTAPTHTAYGTDFSTFRSWEIAIPFLAANCYFDKKKTTGLNLQTFFDWRNYRMTGDQRFVKTDNGHVALAPYPEGTRPKFSRIKVFSLSGALLLEHRFSFNKKWGFQLGPVVNFNTYASIKTRYRQDNAKVKLVDKHIQQRKVTLDYMGVIATPGLDFYLKYSPSDVLKDGVKFRSLTFGLYL